MNRTRIGWLAMTALILVLFSPVGVHATTWTEPPSMDLESLARSLNESESSGNLATLDALGTVKAHVDRAGNFLFVKPIRAALALAGIRMDDPESLSVRVNSGGATLCMVFETGEVHQ